MRRLALFFGCALSLACAGGNAGGSGLHSPWSKGDHDGDGIADDVDKCPDVPEDYDGFQDEDGCPDPDNDQDGILDIDDRCPNIAGSPSKGGCP